MFRILLSGIAILSLSSIDLSFGEKFPQWRGSRMMSYAVWDVSPIVAIGDVVNITSYGEQEVAGLPPPVVTEVHRLYWCRGDFRPRAVLKGKLPASPRKYLWGSPFPGCDSSTDEAHSFRQRLHTKAWFLRVEGDFLRPMFDSGSTFIGVFPDWDDQSHLSARRQFGTLLLTPAAVSDTLKDYAGYHSEAAYVARRLLDKAEYVRQMRALARLNDPDLQEVACGMLKGELGPECNSKK